MTKPSLRRPQWPAQPIRGSTALNLGAQLELGAQPTCTTRSGQGDSQP